MPTRSPHLSEDLTVAEFAAYSRELLASISEEARKVGLRKFADLVDVASAEAANISDETKH